MVGKGNGTKEREKQPVFLKRLFARKITETKRRKREW